MEERHVRIVLVEDDPGHARLIEKNLRRAGIANDITKFEDGQSAVDFLFAPENAEQKDYSLLILLDLNLPVLDGYQVLERIKANEKTRTIPVVVLTTTDSAHEISRCYDLGCNVYVTKPVEYEQFADAIKNLGLFLSIVKIPKS